MKRLQLLIICLCLVLISNAKNISTETAQNAAENFFKQQGISSPKLKLNYTSVFQSDLSLGNQEIATFYIFTSSPKGFVIIAADDAVQPILAYSLENNFVIDNMPDNINWWLNGYKSQIQYVIENNVSATTEISSKWEKLLSLQPISNNGAKAVTALVSQTWDQMGSSCILYNNLSPTPGTSDSSTPVGCAATAMAMIMKYWNWPTTGVGSHSYFDTIGGTLSANFGATTYDWANMPNKLTCSSSTAQKNAVATLMYHCAVAIEMDFNTAANGGSGAYCNSYGGYIPQCSENAFKDYFNYKTSVHSIYRNYSGGCNNGYGYGDEWTETDWKNALKAELDEARPILYSGQGDSGGHAFICDGYNSSDEFHFNWGWSGSNNGYYTVNNLAPGSGGAGGGSYVFNDEQKAVIGIEPINVVAEMKVPATGNNSYTVCEGTIYDNGGSAGNYSGSTGTVQEGYTILYPATTGNKISISGTYAVEQGYDYIYIYDGAGTTSTPIQTLTGSGTLSTVTSTASNGALTIKFYADNYADDIGFAFNIACVGSPSLSMYSNILLSPATISVGAAINLTASIWNSGTAPFTGNIKAVIYNSSNNEIATIEQKSYASSPINAGILFSTGVNFHSAGIPSLNEGTYYVKLLYQRSSSESWSLLANGNYTNSATLIVQNPASIDGNNFNNINIFPNPANEKIFVNGAENSNYQIIDILGKIIKEGRLTSEKYEINLSDMNRGAYFIKIYEDKKVIVRRITKL